MPVATADSSRYLTGVANAAIMLLQTGGGDRMQVKRITIRVPPELHQQLSRLAASQSVSLNTLAVEALEAYAETLVAGRGRFPLRELSALLAPAAEAADLTEEELLHYARLVRRRIWRERYERAVQSHSDRQEPA
ncbi:MAG TPA: toxin-antitoxin system HicB family antitoxin [Anaerolineae bacterium]|nr:toxin-antitoxin system HicB family antitoxin [Anaerolineae bacterium]